MRFPRNNPAILGRTVKGKAALPNHSPRLGVRTVKGKHFLFNTWQTHPITAYYVPTPCKLAPIAPLQRLAQ